MIYESADYHNAVFVGFDSNGNAKHAHKRGTGSESSYKGNVTGASRNLAFTGMGRLSLHPIRAMNAEKIQSTTARVPAVACSFLKRRLICFHLFPCKKSKSCRKYGRGNTNCEMQGF